VRNYFFGQPACNQLGESTLTESVQIRTQCEKSSNNVL